MPPELSPELQPVLKRVTEDFERAEKVHAAYRERWEHFYRLYRSYSDFADWYGQADRRDRDEGLKDAQTTWGAELFIPYSFATVEQILPRAISNRPRMLILPRDKASDRNVENMKFLIDAQQQAINYELKVQETVKSGFIYGLGVQKTLWRTKTVRGRPTVEATIPEPGKEWVLGDAEEKVVFDGPDVEDIDIFDWFWDPGGHSIETLRYAVHRTWRDTRYVRKMVESGLWSNPAGLLLDDVKDMGSQRHDEFTQQRLTAGGVGDARHDESLHEVWEYHDGEQVVTVLDREYPMQIGPNPTPYGELPFQVFRPTTSGMKELPGIGEIEPIEHLQREMNTLRSQRRDNASLKLNQPSFAADGMVDPNDWQFFPGSLILTNGEPRDTIWQPQVGDIPNSGYQEEANLQADIERTTGLSDAVSGIGDASQTATGVQMIQAAANVRIQLKTRRVEAELIAPAAHQWGAMNQQKILGSHDVRIEAAPTPGDPARRWTWRTLTPNELRGEFDFVAEGGSIAPTNVPQDRADATALLQSFRGDPQVDQRVLYREVFRLFGQKVPDAWLTPDQRIPPVMLDILVQQFKIPKDQLAQALELAHQFEEAQKQGSPNASQNGGGPAQQAEPEVATA